MVVLHLPLGHHPLSMKCFIWVWPLPPIFPMSKVVHYHICLQTGEIEQLCDYHTVLSAAAAAPGGEEAGPAGQRDGGRRGTAAGDRACGVGAGCSPPLSPPSPAPPSVSLGLWGRW